MTSAPETGPRRLQLRPQAGIAALAALLFIGLSIWWLLYDKHVPGGDATLHLWSALTVGDMIGSGDFGSILELGPTDSTFYPPLVHAVGGIAAALDLRIEDWGTIAVNIVFVPLLAAGCYLTGRLVYGPTAGMLAAIFALGSPLVLSLFHDFLLDAPLVAMIAITVWALLASDRFSKTSTTVLAGALVGLALLVKPIAPVYLIGPVVVMLLGGGWRQWRNLLLGAAALLIVAGPYYAIHLGDLISISGDAASGDVGPAGAFNVEFSNPRFTLDAVTWYGWIAVNNQYFVPLMALFLIGTVLALRELRRRRHLPELLAGLAGGYLLVTLAFAIRDPRYTLPLVVFVAVLATGWITVVSRPLLRRAAVAVLGIAVALNVAVSATARLPALRLVPPDTKVGIIDRGSLTFLDDRGYSVGVPRPDPFWDRLLTSAKEAGLHTARINIRETLPWGGSDPLGFAIFAREHGIDAPSGGRPDPDLRINTWWRPAVADAQGRRLPRPCGTVGEGLTTSGGDEPIPVKVAVERRLPGGGYQRWCDF